MSEKSTTPRGIVGHPRIRIRCVSLSPPSPALPLALPPFSPPLCKQLSGFDGFPLSISLGSRLLAIIQHTFDTRPPDHIDDISFSSLHHIGTSVALSGFSKQQTTVLSRNHPPFLICALQFHNKEIRFLHRHYPSSRYTFDHR